MRTLARKFEITPTTIPKPSLRTSMICASEFGDKQKQFFSLSKTFVKLGSWSWSGHNCNLKQKRTRAYVIIQMHPPPPPNFLKLIKPSPLSYVVCCMSYVICCMSYVICCMSHVPYPMSHVFCPKVVKIFLSYKISLSAPSLTLK